MAGVPEPLHDASFVAWEPFAVIGRGQDHHSSVSRGPVYDGCGDIPSLPYPAGRISVRSISFLATAARVLRKDGEKEFLGCVHMTSHLIHRFCVVAAFALAAIGPVRAQLLLDTTADFTLSAQGANGLYYGYFDGPETESSSFFHTNGIATNAAQPDLGEVWQGTEAFGTPLFSAGYQHPGASDGSSAVRRYLVGAGDEPDYTGWVRIQGSFGGPNPYGTGSVGVFVNVNDTNLFSMVTGAAEAVGFDLLAWVAPTWFIDFGVRPNGDAAFDVTPFHATVTAVPEPATTGAMGAALALLVVTFGRRRPPVDRGEAESSRPLS